MRKEAKKATIRAIPATAEQRHRLPRGQRHEGHIEDLEQTPKRNEEHEPRNSRDLCASQRQERTLALAASQPLPTERARPLGQTFTSGPKRATLVNRWEAPLPKREAWTDGNELRRSAADTIDHPSDNVNEWGKDLS